MIKFLWSCFKNCKAALAAVAFCSVLTAAVNLFEPFLTAKFIDEILISRNPAIFHDFILLLLVLSVLAIAANWFNTILSSRVRLKINNQVIESVMSHVYRAGGNFIFKTDMVYLSKRLDQDAIDLIRFAIDSMTDVCINFALLCMAAFLLASIGLKWLALFVIIALLHGAAYRTLKKILFERSTAVRETDSKYFTCLSDILLYVYSIKLQGVYAEWLKKFRAAFEKNFAAVMRQVKIIFWFNTSSLNANAVFKVLIFFLGGLDVLAGDMTVGNFVALNGYYLLAMQGVAYFMNIGQNYQNARAAYIRIMEIKNVPPEITGTKILPRVESITVQNVSYSFGERKLLQNFTRKFERGRIYCIVGKNGAGKSTLINLICGMLRPASGEISYNQIPIAELDMIHTRKKNIAVVEQKDFRKNETLSGGERRKISIGAAFEKDSDVMIFDEPDNNLDTAAVAELLDRIKSGRESRITLIISHDERLTAIADEIVNLSAKKLKE